MLKKIIAVAVNAVSVAVICLALCVLLSVVFTERGKVPGLFGYHMLCVVSGSMEPAISMDDLLLVHRTEVADIHEGDVISFYSNDPALHGAVNTHRVTDRKQTQTGYSFTTKGDANYAEDAYCVAEEDLLGVVVFVSPLLGKAARLVKNPFIFFAAVMLPLVGILLSNLIRIIRLTKKAVYEEERLVMEQYRCEQEKRSGDTENKEENI